MRQAAFEEHLKMRRLLRKAPSFPFVEEASSLTVYRKKQGEGVVRLRRAAFEEHLKNAPLIARNYKI